MIEKFQPEPNSQIWWKGSYFVTFHSSICKYKPQIEWWSPLVATTFGFPNRDTRPSWSPLHYLTKLENLFSIWSAFCKATIDLLNIDNIDSATKCLPLSFSIKIVLFCSKEPSDNILAMLFHLKWTNQFGACHHEMIPAIRVTGEKNDHTCRTGKTSST